MIEVTGQPRSFCFSSICTTRSREGTLKNMNKRIIIFVIFFITHSVTVSSRLIFLEFSCKKHLSPNMCNVLMISVCAQGAPYYFLCCGCCSLSIEASITDKLRGWRLSLVVNDTHTQRLHRTIEGNGMRKDETPSTCECDTPRQVNNDYDWISSINYFRGSRKTSLDIPLPTRHWWLPFH